ncbi:hypothetical protein [Lactiplantibacillus plantarum]|uniref:hypothetical protein n=1 Tax=Lactiplantibacillus plantarum TaxID=1590 RepID=UPI00404545DC
MLAERRNHARQQVARLGVGAGDHQAAFVAAGEFVADLLEVVDFAHDAVDHLRHGQAGLGQALDAFTVAFEDLDPEFVLELDDGLGRSRRRWRWAGSTTACCRNKAAGAPPAASEASAPVALADFWAGV